MKASDLLMLGSVLAIFCPKRLVAEVCGTQTVVSRAAGLCATDLGVQVQRFYVFKGYYFELEFSELRCCRDRACPVSTFGSGLLHCLRVRNFVWNLM